MPLWWISRWENLNMDAYNDMSERIVGARSAEQSGINAKTKKENAE